MGKTALECRGPCQDCPRPGNPRCACCTLCQHARSAPHTCGGLRTEGAGLSLSVSFEGKSRGLRAATGLPERRRWTPKLLFSGRAVTEMACVQPEKMDREAAWLKALGEVRGFVASPEGLWLRREDGSVAVCLW
ncbi:MAG: META domain-containing protein [Pseudomonadota bacterium]